MDSGIRQLGIIVTLVTLTGFVGIVTGRGSSAASNSAVTSVGSYGYRAKRYGSYYSTVYFSYSGKSYARFGRVYRRQKNLYPAFYNYMFEWFQTEEFQIYQQTPSAHISVCKNYEADANGTYLGIFTCPLPFVPKDFYYCCGEKNAQYCCRFWDLPTNVAGVVIMSVMGLCTFVAMVYISVQLCINRYWINEENKRRKALRRIGLLRRYGRRISSWSLVKLFDQMHAESTFSEHIFETEEEEEATSGEENSHTMKAKEVLCDNISSTKETEEIQIGGQLKLYNSSRRNGRKINPFPDLTGNGLNKYPRTNLHTDRKLKVKFSP